MEKYRKFKLRSGAYVVYNESKTFSKYVDTDEEAKKLKKELNDAISEESD